VSVHPIVTLLPGWKGSSSVVRALGEDTAWPFSEVMTSPSVSPLSCAGELVTTEHTNAPDELLLPEPCPLPPPLPKPPPPKPDPEPPKPPPPVLSLLHVDWATSTPRKAVAPMWTVEEAVPASICLAIVTASLIGMA
jgi:hypothetical protein